MAKITHWTQHRLTSSMLAAMASMHSGQRHKYGTMMQALEARSPDDPLIREREAKCPECGSTRIAEVESHSMYDWDAPGDKLHCGHCCQINPRKKWGGCYGFAYELTETGLQALAAARKEGW